MIGRLRGTLADKQPPLLLIDVGGVGYEVECPLSVFSELPDLDQQVTLLIHQIVKEDSNNLYGFLADHDRSLFRSLLRISGVGAKLALTLLSGMTAEEFAVLVHDGDVAALTRLPGIGKKTAERLIIEMKDRLDGLATEAVRLPGRSGLSRPASADGEAREALVSLGYKPAEASSMVRKVMQEGMSAEEIIRLCLKQSSPS